MIRAPLVVGVTGHRNLAAHEIETVRARVRECFTQLQRDFPQLPLVVLSSLAEGADQLVAEEALAAGARLVAPLPLARDLYAQDFTDPVARAKFDALCARAQVLELPLLADNTQAAVATASPARDRQYTQAGIFVASHSHILLALWDGRPSAHIGGTAQIVRFHMDGIPPSAGGAQPGRVTLDTGDESLLYHVVCSRNAGADGISPPLPPLRAGEARWVTDRGSTAAGTGMPAEFRRMFEHMQQFNDDVARHGDAIAATAPEVANDQADSARAPSAAALFAAADGLAIHCQRQVQRAMRSLYALAALMGIAFVYYSDTPNGLPGQADTIYAFVVLFAAGALLAWITRRHQWQRKYIDYRALAEGLRVQDYWHRAGVGAGDAGAFAHDSFMQKQDVELGWIRHVMRSAALAAALSTTSPDIEPVIAEWIGTPGGNGQLGYYAHKSEQRRHAHARYEAIARILLVGAVATSVILALFSHWLDADAANWLVALMGVLAVIAAVRESYAFHKADKELINQYQYMGAIFASARRQLDATDDPALRRAILRALGDAALAEHAEWALMHRLRPLEAGKL